MPSITKIENVKSLIQKLRILESSSKQEDNGSVITGFNAAYAVFVHEIKPKTLGKGIKRTGYYPPGKKRGAAKRKGKWWDPQGRGRPKYLEEPARSLNNSGELARVVRESYDKQGSLVKALLQGGLRIQREAQELVPVDLGNLKGSAFTEVE